MLSPCYRPSRTHNPASTPLLSDLLKMSTDPRCYFELGLVVVVVVVVVAAELLVK